jgi:hypothetical protein
MEDIKQEFREAWEDGFFYNLRQGIFNEYQYEKLRSVLERCVLHLNASDTIDKELVKLIWFTPLFVDWQRERLLEKGVDESTIRRASNYFFDRCQEILGLP